MAPPTLSELIFSEQANHNFSKTLTDLKKHTLSIHNRLSSILEDADFVQRLAAAYDRPLIANERCGSWYIDPSFKAGSAYFKSTDGHTSVWKFSTRRLNTHLLQWIGRHDGCIIVDSTRRGKRMPDALSKTIPIWCCVLNRALFPDDFKCHELFTPPQVVSASENAQISACIDGFVQSFLDLRLDLASMRKELFKPLRPMWVTPESHIIDTSQVFEDYHPVICCTASRRVTGGEISEGGYIQGSGDDTEHWAFGLTPSLFWSNSEKLLRTAESELPDLIAQLLSQTCSDDAKSLTYKPVSPTFSLYIVSTDKTSDLLLGARQMAVSLSTEITVASTWQISTSLLKVGLGPHKIGSKNLRTALPTIMDFLSKKLRVTQSKDELNSLKIVIACASGKDHSVGVALAILCSFYDEEGSIYLGNQDLERPKIDKLLIKRRLGWIMTSMSDANPSRATLQSINSYLMERPP